MKQLKFTGLAHEGQTIRGHDFAPRLGVGECYIEGVVTNACMTDPRGCQSFEVLLTKRVWDGKDISAKSLARSIHPAHPDSGKVALKRNKYEVPI